MRHRELIEVKRKAYDALHAQCTIDKLGQTCLDIVYTTLGVHLQPGSGVVQGGAFHGRLTTTLAQKVWPAGRVWAFEPQSGPRTGCFKRLQIAKLEEVVTLSPVALSDESGVSKFHVFPETPGLSGIRPRQVRGREKAEVRVVEVTLGRLDDLIPAGANVEAIVLDIEGGEFPALRGARNILSQQRPLLALENGRGNSARDYGYTAEELFEYFAGLDYELFDCLGFEFGPADWTIPRQPWWYFGIPRERRLMHGVVHGSIDSTLERLGLDSILP